MTYRLCFTPTGELSPFGRRFLGYTSMCIQEHLDDIDNDIDVPAGHVSRTLPDAAVDYKTQASISAMGTNYHGFPGRRHNPCCFKYGSCDCRFNFPRALVEESKLTLIEGQTFISERFFSNNECTLNFNICLCLQPQGKATATSLSTIWSAPFSLT